MKKILIVASLAALVAVGCNSAQTPATEATATSESAPSGAIAFIEYDSLISNYDMYNDLVSAYQVKLEKAEKDLTTKGRSIENQIKDYQNKVQNGLVTRAQAQNIEEDLTQKQQTFMQQREQKMAELSEEEQVMMNQIQFSINEFIEEYNKDYRFSLILCTTPITRVILSGDPKLNITKEVTDGLNAIYQKQNKDKK